MKPTAKEIIKDLELVRAGSPLVHNITNYVVMNSTANALLAVGASPVMAHAVEEVEDMVAIASALVINIGTLSEPWVAAMAKAAAAAGRKGIPIVYDPVGVGATPYRTRVFRGLLEIAPPAVMRGNASEIMAVDNDGAATRGVDSSAATESAMESARRLAVRWRCTVCVSGATDIIVDAEHAAAINNGHPLMPKVTGLGCTATALCGAFAAVEPDFFRATVAAMAVMGIAGEIAGEKSPGPGSLQVHFLDALYNLDGKEIEQRLKIS
jgi:hydroxyethylthiazole kinase